MVFANQKKTLVQLAAVAVVVEHERVVVVAVAEEIAGHVAEFPELFRYFLVRIGIVEIDDPEAQQGMIEMQAFVHLVCVKAEMAEAADLERPVQHDAADIEFSV